jgi:hypothetical protein
MAFLNFAAPALRLNPYIFRLVRQRLVLPDDQPPLKNCYRYLHS